MARFKVWLPAETLLYMPIYALEDLGILARVATVAGISGASIKVAISPRKSDLGCIEHMLREAGNESDSGDIHIAICDPIKTLQVDEGNKTVALLGAFIKRPTFWVVGRHAKSDLTESDHRYVYYNDKLETGHFLGRRAARFARDSHRQVCDLGEEFDKLDEIDREGGAGCGRAITADIRKLVERQAADDSIQILKRISRDSELQHFVTCSVVTHRKYRREQTEALALFMEALRSACILLRTAEKPTAALVEQIMIREDADAAKEKGLEPQSPPPELSKTAEAITEQLFIEEIYSDSLSITQGEWMGAFNVRHADGAARRRASRFFLEIYDSNPSRELTSRWLIRAIKDYGRFATDAKRLRGASIFSLLSTCLLVLHVVFAGKYASGQTDLTANILRWTSIGSLALGAGLVATLAHALLSDGRSLIRPLQRMWAFDDQTATGIMLGVITIVLFSIAGLFVTVVLRDTTEIVGFIFTFCSAMAAILVAAVRAWFRMRRDA